MKAVVVLGCRIVFDKDTQTYRPSKVLQCRLEKAIEVFKQINDQEHVIVMVTGGATHKNPVSEALVMKRYLVEKGIREGYIFTEEKSTNTIENCMFSHSRLVKLYEMRLISQELAPFKELYVITSDFHILRTEKIFRHFLSNTYVLYFVSAPTPLEEASEYIRRERLTNVDCLLESYIVPQKESIAGVKRLRLCTNPFDQLSSDLLCIILRYAWSKKSQPQLASVCSRWHNLLLQSKYFFQFVVTRCKQTIPSSAPFIYIRRHICQLSSVFEKWHYIYGSVCASFTDNLIRLNLSSMELKNYLEAFVDDSVPMTMTKPSLWCELQHSYSNHERPNILRIVDFYRNVAQISPGKLELISAVFILQLPGFIKDHGLHFEDSKACEELLFQRWSPCLRKAFFDYLSYSKPTVANIDCTEQILRNPDLLLVNGTSRFNLLAVLRSHNTMLTSDHLRGLLKHGVHDTHLAEQIFTHKCFDPSDIRYLEVVFVAQSATDSMSIMERLLQLYPQEKAHDLVKLFRPASCSDAHQLLLFNAHGGRLRQPDLFPKAIVKAIYSRTAMHPPSDSNTLASLQNFLQKNGFNPSLCMAFVVAYYCQRKSRHDKMVQIYRFARGRLRLTCSECNKLLRRIPDY